MKSLLNHTIVRKIIEDADKPIRSRDIWTRAIKEYKPRMKYSVVKKYCKKLAESDSTSISREIVAGENGGWYYAYYTDAEEKTLNQV